MMRALRWILALSVLLIGAGALLRDAWLQLRTPLVIAGGSVVHIPPGAPFQSVLDQMGAAGYFGEARTATYLRFYGRLAGLNTQIKAGEYELSPGMSALDAVYRFVSGKTLQHILRVAEGMTFAELMKAVRGAEALRQTLAHPLAADEAMQALGLDGASAEGRFYPDTYHFVRDTTDVAFLRRAAAAMDAVLEEEWSRREPGLPYGDAYEALVMASIIEKETGIPAERATVAGVFVNRLRLGMRLQTDPTVIYGLGAAFDGNLRRADLVADTPYNTYTRRGLPPTPICMPGRAAIHAALHPQATKALFFVSRGDGSHVFSETLDEHNAAVSRYQLRRGPREQEKSGEDRQTTR
jgi:UPF0755 protein